MKEVDEISFEEATEKEEESILVPFSTKAMRMLWDEDKK